MKDAKHYKVCACKEAMNPETFCCKGCGRSKLDNPGTGKKTQESFQESIEPLPFLSAEANAARAEIEARILGNKKALLSGRKMSQEALLEAYKGLGMSEDQAKICVGSEMILESSMDKQVHSLLPEADLRRRTYDVARLMGMNEQTALDFSAHPSHRINRDFQDFVFDDLIA